MRPSGSELQAAEAAADRDSVDLSFMRAALALGRRGLGVTAPNPAVGALVVKDGIIVGRGATQAGGRPHAEAVAIAAAGGKTHGATLYVTLEPCSHRSHAEFGPSCTDLILQAGLARVVIAAPDPSPFAAGEASARLAAAGVTVATGIEQATARRANLGHILRVTKGRPMVTLKVAETADGYAAAAPGAPRLMITGPAANNRVQILRAQHDAILIGSGTAIADNPRLTVRAAGLEGRRPLRVVMDSRLILPLSGHLVTGATEWPTLVLTTDAAAAAAQTALEARGVTIERVAADGQGHVDLHAGLRVLAARGLTRVLAETGPTLSVALIDADLADTIIVFTGSEPAAAPGRAAFSDAALAALAGRSRHAMVAAGKAGADSFRCYERVLLCSPD